MTVLVARVVPVVVIIPVRVTAIISAHQDAVVHVRVAPQAALINATQHVPGHV